MALKYKQTFTVKGTLQFPIDMPRDDDCFPFDESDRGKIEQAMDTRFRPVGSELIPMPFSAEYNQL